MPLNIVIKIVYEGTCNQLNLANHKVVYDYDF